MQAIKRNKNIFINSSNILKINLKTMNSQNKIEAKLQ